MISSEASELLIPASCQHDAGAACTACLRTLARSRALAACAEERARREPRLAAPKKRRRKPSKPRATDRVEVGTALGDEDRARLVALANARGMAVAAVATDAVERVLEGRLALAEDDRESLRGRRDIEPRRHRVNATLAPARASLIAASGLRPSVFARRAIRAALDEVSSSPLAKAGTHCACSDASVVGASDGDPLLPRADRFLGGDRPAAPFLDESAQ